MSIEHLATVKRLTGRIIKLNVLESVDQVQVTDERIVVLITRAATTENRYGLVVNRRGNTILEFTKTNGAWVQSEPLTVWYDLDEPEVHTARHTTAEEQAAQAEWERMCYRPGTARTPMDNAARKAQGIK